MARNICVVGLCIAFLGLAGVPLAAIDIHDTRMLSTPAVSADHVAFTYASDLWVVERQGDMRARRLTGHIGREGWPHFSPDGRWIAFTGEYDGNMDVFLVSVDGGEPQRLTWHPDADVAQGFTPDGSAVLFHSPRASHTRRHRQLFTVSVDGGLPSQLPIPHAFKAKYSPDGNKIAYRPQNDVFWQWKNYRGGTHGRIWVYDVASHDVVEVPQPEGRINDTDPAWLGDDLYFISDRAGEFNLFRYRGETVEQLTRYVDFPILGAATGGGVVIYEQAGRLHIYDPATSSSTALAIGVATDLVERRARYEGGWEHLRSAGLSPSGSRVALGVRGEIVTVPVEKGDPRYLTQTPGAHERESEWSPDGRHIAFFSDVSGEYALHVAPQDGKGDAKAYPLNGSGFYDMIRWSPDSKKISYRDNSRTIYWIELSSGEITKVSSDVLYGPVNQLHHAWSPDSRWLAYTRVNEANFQQAFVYNLEDGSSHQVTDGLSNVLDPVFDADGKYLYFLASTDAGPVRTWFAQSNADMEANYSLYLAVLAKGEPSPLAAESDEEEPQKSAADEDGDAKSAPDKKGKKGKKAAAGKDAGQGGDKDDAPEVHIDFEGLDQRILALPVEAAALNSLSAGSAGQIYYLKAQGRGGLFGGPLADLHHFDLNERKDEVMFSGVTGYAVSAKGGKVMAATPQKLVVGGAKGSLDKANKVNVDAVRLRIDPVQEWEQIFHEAWRINRDYFYDPGMHGADWDAMRTKYAQFLPHLTTRSDLNRLIQWLCSELAVGHHRNGGGDSALEAESVPGGLLGADFRLEDGRYQFVKVLGGLNWNPDLRAPLTEPGVEVSAGDYLLSVNGRDLTADDNIFEFFEHTAGTRVELTVGSQADGSNARTVHVVPVESEAALRNRDWVEGNLRKVDEATDGRVAYVHVPDTAGRGHAYFKRYFFPQVHKDAVIVDERYNGGGQIADYYIDILRRPSISHWTTRYGQDLHTPLGAIHGPKVMIIDETAGSGGDLLPWMFSKLEIGPLVGKRTWGGLVGVLGFPVLMDGGGVTAPNIAIWTEDGFVVESVGVPPDIEVEQLPKDVIAGHDPQLEKAIELALQALEANPPKKPTRPPFPVRAMQH